MSRWLPKEVSLTGLAVTIVWNHIHDNIAPYHLIQPDYIHMRCVLGTFSYARSTPFGQGRNIHVHASELAILRMMSKICQLTAGLGGLIGLVP